MRRTAIVRVITDWARLGVPRHLHRKVLRALYEAYWRQKTGSPSTTAVSMSGFREARDWATSPDTDRPRLIDIVGAGHHQPHPLLTVVAKEPDTGWPVAGPLWTYVTRTLPLRERLLLALQTFDRGDYPHTRRLLTTCSHPKTVARWLPYSLPWAYGSTASPVPADGGNASLPPTTPTPHPEP
ncbi:hypothetical protein [Actinoplanes sp. N902-109]|uniref:hypothetical protein n=1 Tax=Actinoplanes sp. (strain N902-109) TaxID=649831 RepID=UPI000329630A|nr:hypothetical protein [Actinoplanes sp. N902-109]AGL16111.1 hypothetical protein L083_2601 [Actinoplanes sp. N902-109]